jgi:hypothetical protein
MFGHFDLYGGALPFDRSREQMQLTLERRLFAGMVIPIVVAAALLSAVGPAESAVRGSLAEALEYE